MTEETTQKLAELSAEAERLRAARTGMRARWPADFQEKVGRLASRGVKPREIARVARISTWSVYQWRAKRKGRKFSEVRVVDGRHLSKAKAASEEIVLRTPRGYEVTLRAENFRQLLREGLI